MQLKDKSMQKVYAFLQAAFLFFYYNQRMIETFQRNNVGRKKLPALINALQALKSRRMK